MSRHGAGAIGVRRLPAIIVLGLAIAGLVLAGSVVDRRGADEVAELAAGTPTPAQLAPAAPDASATGSTWYCAGGTATDGGAADHEIVIANTGDADLTAEVTVFAGAQEDDDAGRAAAAATEPVSRSLDVAARSRVDLRLGDVLQAPYASALVEVEGGEVVVEEVVRGGGDFDTAPCQTTPAATWQVAAGNTLLGSQELLVLFNPFADDAVVDIRFATPEGIRTPTDFSGYVVPGRRTVAIDVGLVVSRHAQVSITVAARSGRLVVDKIQRFTADPTGLAITPAAPAPAALWYFPEGYVADGISELVTIYNPTEDQAAVDVELILPPSDDPEVIAVEPFELTVPPGGFTQIDLGTEDRVPKASGHAVVVRSQNGVPVVAERWERAGAGSVRPGFSATLGSPVASTRWLAAAGGTPSDQTQSEFVLIVNPSALTIATVTITVPTPQQQLVPEGLADLEVPVGGRLVLELGASLNRDELPLVVSSNHPVIVERGLYRGAEGFAQSMAVPVGADASIPSVDSSAVEGGVVTSESTIPVETTLAPPPPSTEPTTAGPGATTPPSDTTASSDTTTATTAPPG